MENTKYELLKHDTKEVNGKTLYRIKALRDISSKGDFAVPKGTLGGYIEDVRNLSTLDDSWIDYGSIVMDKSVIRRDSLVKRNCIIKGHVNIRDSVVSGDVEISGTVRITSSKIFNHCNIKAINKNSIRISNCDKVSFSNIYGSASLCDSQIICSTIACKEISVTNSTIYECSAITGDDISIKKNSIIRNAKLLQCKFLDISSSGIYDVLLQRLRGEVINSHIGGNVSVQTRKCVRIVDSKLDGSFVIKPDIRKISGADLNIDCDEYLVLQGTNSRKVTVVFKDGIEYYTVGCQHSITKEKFLERIHSHYGGIEENPHRREYLSIINMVSTYLKGKYDTDIKK